MQNSFQARRARRRYAPTAPDQSCERAGGLLVADSQRDGRDKIGKVARVLDELFRTTSDSVGNVFFNRFETKKFLLIVEDQPEPSTNSIHGNVPFHH